MHTRLRLDTLTLLTLFLPAVVVDAQDPTDLLGVTPQPLQASSPVTMNDQAVRFGSAIDLDRSVVVVGAPQERSTDGAAANAGAVYVFERQGFDWVEMQKLRAPTETAQERFGDSVGVALGGLGEDFLVVGAPGAGAGRAYLFRRAAGGPWSYEETLTNGNPDNGDRCGDSVAVDYYLPHNSLDDQPVFVVVVGAPQDRDPVGSGSLEGSAAIFQRSGDPMSWNRTHEFFGTNGDLFGSSVAISRGWVVVGVESLDDAGFSAGGARTFAQENQQPGGEYHYAETRALLPSDPQIQVGLGLSAAISDDPVNGGIAALGAHMSDDGAFDAGKVYVYDIDPGGMGVSQTEVAILQPSGLPPIANFGKSVDVTGKLLAAGAPGVGTDGTVYLFERGATKAEWSLVGPLTMPAVAPPFTCDGGTAVAVQGLTVVVGCPAGRAQDERVYVYSTSEIFFDGFESGDTSAWTSSIP